MKKMVWDIPLATLGQFLNADKVKVGYWNIQGGKFYDELPLFEGEMGDLMWRNKEARNTVWEKISMKRVNYIQAQGDVLIIGVERFELN